MKLLHLILFLMVSAYSLAQRSSELKTSLTIGYGSQGLFAKLDGKLSELNNNARTPVKFFIDGNFKGKTFEQSSLIFNGDTYPSDANQFMVGLGGGLDFTFNDFSIYPFLGARYYYVRFKDKNLFDGIGTSNLTRYHNNSNGGRIQVGPTVENAYGNAISLDLGMWIGYHISPSVEIGGMASVSPVKFSTAGSLFGEYWGQSPYVNPYYVKVDIIRFQGGLRFYF